MQLYKYIQQHQMSLTYLQLVSILSCFHAQVQALYLINDLKQNLEYQRVNLEMVTTNTNPLKTLRYHLIWIFIYLRKPKSRLQNDLQIFWLSTPFLLQHKSKQISGQFTQFVRQNFSNMLLALSTIHENSFYFVLQRCHTTQNY